MRDNERVGVLLINTGSTAAPTPKATRAYLREFLSDPRMLDMPAALRWLLLNLVILPGRSARSARAYRSIWTNAGSPLIVHGQALRDALRASMPETEVVLAMRYGTPSIAQGVATLLQRDVDRILVAPLFPHYSSATTGSALECVYKRAAAHYKVPPLSVLPSFYSAPEYLDACAVIAQPLLDEVQPDHVVMSYHGLPERHVRKGDPTGAHCLVKPDCCASIGPDNRNCYRAQCMATSCMLADRLGLTPNTCTVSFQSRMGREPWLTPTTVDTVVQLAERGTRRLLIMCPGLTADCLETLEEIGMRARDAFLAAGGTHFTLVPCLNAHPAWVQGLASLLRRI